MNVKDKINQILKKRVLILDGATGTELQKHGMPAGISPEKWCLENPAVLKKIHSDFVKAGADVIYTSTIGANLFKLHEYGIKNVREINKKLAVLAGTSANGKAIIAGDIGPTGLFVKPFGKLDFEEAVDAFKEQVKGLLEGGVDIFVIETMMDIQEARAALIAVKEITDKFVMVTMTYEKDGKTLYGTDAVTSLITLQSLGADAVGCNCSTGPMDMIKLISAMKPYAKVPLVSKPNAGTPELINGKTIFNMDPAQFSSFGKELVLKGANIIGGCCGTTCEHIYSLKKEIRKIKPIGIQKTSLSAVSSATKTVILSEEKPLYIIGERINPTGKKEFQKELREGKLSYIRNIAKVQEEKGADLLDVNVGTSGIDEEKIFIETVNLLSTITSLPLVIDSSNIKVIEKAVRYYPGRALINSISGEKEKLKKVLPIAAKYGAMFILLPITDKDIPATAEKRINIIKNIFKQSQKFKFTKDDIVIDGLVMSVASDPKAALETLKTIEWVSKVFRCKTVVGLSNVSFGMPAREWMNASFLAMAVSKGLTMAIADPLKPELMNSAKSADVLCGKDEKASLFINYFSKNISADKKDKPVQQVSPEQKISQAVIEGNRNDIEKFINEAVSCNVPASKLVHEIMIPAINKVGELYAKKEYFLPQLIASAETMEKAFKSLEPYLKKQESSQRKNVFLIATVKGDIHDIGKNIVALMLKNHGFYVIDLGKDISSEKIIAGIKKHKPDIVGLSALMTTTMVNMKEVINQSKKEKLNCRFMIGGAVVTELYAKSIGAEYAKDGVDAVRVAKQLITD